MSSLKPIFTVTVALSMLVAAPCYSEDWERVSSDTEADKVYYDLDSIESNAQGVYVWIMVDFSTSVMGVFSKKSHVQMDCDKKTYRIHQEILFESSFGSGEAYVTDVITAEIIPVAKDQGLVNVMNGVCAL